LTKEPDTARLLLEKPKPEDGDAIVIEVIQRMKEEQGLLQNMLL
jgi:hypothetical protein